jgi:hypothetical protein
MNNWPIGYRRRIANPVRRVRFSHCSLRNGITKLVSSLVANQFSRLNGCVGSSPTHSALMKKFEVYICPRWRYVTHCSSGTRFES